MLQKSSSFDSTTDAAKLRIISDMLVVFLWYFKGALVSARLCRLPEQEVHQPSTWMPSVLLVQRRQLHPLKNAVCLVGAAETAAPPDVCSKSVIRVSSVCSVGDDFCALKISQKKFCDPPPNPMQILYKWVQRKSSFWRNERRVLRFKKAKVGRKTIKSEGF